MFLFRRAKKHNPYLLRMFMGWRATETNALMTCRRKCKGFARFYKHYLSQTCRMQCLCQVNVSTIHWMHWVHAKFNFTRDIRFRTLIGQASNKPELWTDGCICVARRKRKKCKWRKNSLKHFQYILFMCTLFGEISNNYTTIIDMTLERFFL